MPMDTAQVKAIDEMLDAKATQDRLDKELIEARRVYQRAYERCKRLVPGLPMHQHFPTDVDY